jgi:hypothetical protein
MGVRAVRWSIVAAIGGLTVLAIVSGLGSRTDTLRQLVTETLAERLDSEVELGSFSVDTIPSVHITGTGLRIRHKNRHDVPPLVSVEAFTIDGGLIGLWTRPRRFRSVTLSGLRVNIPPGGLKSNSTGDSGVANSPQTPNTPPATPKDQDPGPIVIDRLVSDDAAIVLIPRRADKEPKIFQVQHLTMEPLGRGKVMSYQATLTNPLPKGDIHTVGTFGPWNKEDPGATGLTGRYTFDNVDLATVKGIGGHLTSTGTFSGQLDRIAVSGETRTPDFFIKAPGNPVPLTTKFEAVVDGTDGDTYLNSVAATFLRTALASKGAVVGAEGVKGRTVKVHVDIEDGRIEDILRLAVHGENPLLRGRLALHADMALPAGPSELMDRLTVAGDMDIAGARFSDPAVQEKLSNLSERARGLDPEETADNVTSDVRAKFTLARGVIGLRDASFRMPGATVQMTGTYGLFNEALQFDGTVRMHATVSEAAGGGIKGTLLKAVDPLFRRNGSGAVLPIQVRGSRKDPKIGLDLKKVVKRKS